MQPKEGDLRVWWVPQIPMESFYTPVKNIDEAILILDTLAKYDIFQYESYIKPDYCNAGGLQIYEDDEWCEWYDLESGMDIDEYREKKLFDITSDENIDEF
jgi:hypothetical protein